MHDSHRCWQTGRRPHLFIWKNRVDRRLFAGAGLRHGGRLVPLFQGQASLNLTLFTLFVASMSTSITLTRQTINIIVQKDISIILALKYIILSEYAFRLTLQCNSHLLWILFKCKTLITYISTFPSCLRITFLHSFKTFITHVYSERLGCQTSQTSFKSTLKKNTCTLAFLTVMLSTWTLDNNTVPCKGDLLDPGPCYLPQLSSFEDANSIKFPMENCQLQNAGSHFFSATLY